MVSQSYGHLVDSVLLLLHYLLQILYSRLVSFDVVLVDVALF